MKLLKKLPIAVILPVLVIVTIAVLLFIYEQDFLWKTQELNLFINTSLFFHQQMVMPGGLLTWVGTFFTQFLHQPVLGLLLLAAWWLLLTWLVQRTFRIEGWWRVASVVPVVLILVTIVDMGYWIYFLKLRGHFFVTTIGTTAVTALLWLFRKLYVKSRLTPLFVLLTCAVGYPLLGIYGLAATLLMSIWAWRLDRSLAKAAPVSVTGVVAIIVVPLISCRHLFHQINPLNIYYAELPLFYIREDYHVYYVPFYLLLLFFVAMVLMPYGTKRWEDKFHLAPLSLLIASLVYAGFFWYRDENFHRELAMEHCMEQLDWEGVLKLAAEQRDEPTRAIVVMRNVALARLGRQGDEMFRYRNGSKRINAPFDIPLMMVIGPQIYYHYGMLNFCFRLCMEMGVEFGWRAEHLKMMTRCCLLNGEWKLVHKYTGILENTTYFQGWAEQMDKLAEKPEAIAKSPDLGYVTHMMFYRSTLASDKGYVEEFVMKNLAASTYTDDPIFTEQALLATLWTRNIKQFWRHFATYTKQHPQKQPPIHVQEAAILFGSIEGQNIDKWPFDNSVRESFRRFTEVTPRYENIEVTAGRKALEPLFGKTYYYDYYLMANLQIY